MIIQLIQLVLLGVISFFLSKGDNDHGEVDWKLLIFLLVVTFVLPFNYWIAFVILFGVILQEFKIVGYADVVYLVCGFELLGENFYWFFSFLSLFELLALFYRYKFRSGKVVRALPLLSLALVFTLAMRLVF